MSRAAAPDTIYTNRTSGFQVVHPGDFVVRSEPADRLRQYSPVPLASIFVMNPIMAQGALAMLEPPDLAVRVYRAGAADSLAGWLTAGGLIHEGTSSRNRRIAGIEGLEVCQGTMIAPGCAVYLLADGTVYQLTPGSVAGETMLDTFKVLPRR